MDQNLWEQYQNLKKQRISIIKKTQTSLRQLQKDSEKKNSQLVQISEAQPTSTIQILHNMLINDIKITQQKRKQAKSNKESDIIQLIHLVTSGNANKKETNRAKKIYFENQQINNQKHEFEEQQENIAQSPRFNNKWGPLQPKQERIATNKIKSKLLDNARDQQIQYKSKLIDKFSKISPMLSPQSQRIPISPKRTKKQFVNEQHIAPTSQKIVKNKY